MGEEITERRFEAADYDRFAERLKAETATLKEWIASGRLSDARAVGGFEQEAWLIDRCYSPAPLNDQFLEKAGNIPVSAELARFNVELNVNPLALAGDAIRRFRGELESNWAGCDRIADGLGCKLVMIGILPTVQDADLVLRHMSPLNRYKALNEQVMQARKGVPMRLDIAGHEHLKSVHYDVMLESAATSFQVHRQVPVQHAPRYMNAAMIASAVTVAAGANSPFLFGRRLWEETRIPLFEQSVEVGGLGDAGYGPIRRVTFGGGYVRNDVFECFQENLDHYPPLLPVELDAADGSLAHLRLHNGTIWRWNRPLLGFDGEGVPHVRVEHRVISAGPTIADEIANAAFFYGLQEWLATTPEPPERRLEHAQVKNNFYEGARLGLGASIGWLDGNKVQMAKLITEVLLGQARAGLERLEIEQIDIDDCLGIIEARVATRRTGANWQAVFAERHDRNMVTLLQEYYENQRRGIPVHEWPL